jgi:hypothetical protein
MKNILAFLLVLYLPACASAQVLSLQWAKVLTGTGYVNASHSATDAQGNLYIVGNFSNIADLDPGAGVLNLDAAQGAGYLAKYDGQGDLAWAFQLNADPDLVEVDNNGNVYICGSFNSAADFDPGAGTAQLTPSSTFNMFLAKYSSGGNYINAFNLEQTASAAIAAITSDLNGNIIITGRFEDSLDLDPSVGSQLIISNGGNDDAFIAKYTSAGSIVYGFKLSTSGTDRGSCVVSDAQGNVYAGGTFVTSVDLDPGAGSAIFTLPGINGYLAKYDPSGNYLNGYAFDGTLYQVDLDPSGNIFLSGRMTDSMDADPGAGVSMIYFSGFNDSYLIKLDASGNFQSAKALWGNAQYQATGLTANSQGNFYFYGYMTDSVDLDPASNAGLYESQGGQDIFLGRYDGNLTLSESYGWGSAGTDRITMVNCSSPGNVWMTGYFTGSIDMDLGVNSAILNSPSAAGALIARYSDGTANIPSNEQVTVHPQVIGVKDAVIVDLSNVQNINADIRVLNMLGQTIAEARHHSGNMVRLDLSNIASQVCVVTVTNNGTTFTTKVWIE